MGDNVLIYVAMTSFIVGVIFAPILLPLLRRLKVGQSIREDGPESHMKKSGTPTMGGLIFIFAAILTTLIFGPKEPMVLIVIFSTFSYGLIGFADDYIKVVLRRSLGLKAREKLIFQTLVALIIYGAVYYFDLSTEVLLPYVGAIEFGHFYFPFILVVLLGASNATNMTDGLDGLLAGTFSFSILGMIYIAFSQNEIGLGIFSLSLLGGTLAFLVYNAHPAKVFMGDTGSLALGGGLATLAILTKTELLLIPLGAIFVIETLSIIIQVTSFKLTGKRVFLMSPIHHHFELKGWSEWKIVLVFWFVQLLFTLLAVVLWNLYY
ncbi:phospho-N-acetylmuramoyl-pentapeptide-transferase [Proteinivorax hydrogeniformans]|uniref:Phospho-N-acetylmuramoyl-pentapeptide-transferase n=1 Tax=Proteinivorax hydrogeniformans TaxID=1826727 RepID=A0AAU8HQN4_9FIRM